MYTVGPDYMPEPERTGEAIDLMNETRSFSFNAPHLQCMSFVGEVYEDTDVKDEYSVICYVGLVTSVYSEPPSFNLLVKEAWQQVEDCDCPGSEVDDLFEDFETVIEEARLSQELDDFAGSPTEDPHYEALADLVGNEVTIRFDRLGTYAASCVMVGDS